MGQVREKLDQDLEEVEIDHERKHYEVPLTMLRRHIFCDFLPFRLSKVLLVSEPRWMIKRRWKVNSTCKHWWRKLRSCFLFFGGRSLDRLLDDFFDDFLRSWSGARRTKGKSWRSWRNSQCLWYAVKYSFAFIGTGRLSYAFMGKV